MISTPLKGDFSGFIDRFAASAALRFESLKVRGGPGEGTFDLTGAPAAVAALRQCVDGNLRGQAKDLARYKAERETNFRTDPREALHPDPSTPPC